MDFDFGSLPWGDIAKFGMSLFGSDRAAGRARDAAVATRPVPYSVFGPAGGFQVDPRTNQIMLSPAANPFGTMFNAMGMGAFANAATAPGSFMYGVTPEVAEAYKGTFGQGLTDSIQSNLNLLRSAAAPQENQQNLSLDNQLFSRGQLGTTGGIERFKALQEAHGAADINRQIQAIGLGRDEANQRFQNAMLGTNLGMSQQMQNFNIGAGAFSGLNQLFSNLMQQGQLGVGAGAGQNPTAAMMNAQAQGGPFQSLYNFLNQSGGFDWLNGGGYNAGAQRNGTGTYQPGTVPGSGATMGAPPINTGPLPPATVPPLRM